MAIANFELLSLAVAMLGAGCGMAYYEWVRIKAKRPIMNGSQAVVLYWMAYLSLFVLGATTALAAVLH